MNYHPEPFQQTSLTSDRFAASLDDILWLRANSALTALVTQVSPKGAQGECSIFTEKQSVKKTPDSQRPDPLVHEPL